MHCEFWVAVRKMENRAAAIFGAENRCILRSKERGAWMEKIKIEQHSFTGGLWFAAWLFTIGFLHLSFWQSVIAIVIWPYYLGVKISSLLH